MRSGSMRASAFNAKAASNSDSVCPMDITKPTYQWRVYSSPYRVVHCKNVGGRTMLEVRLTASLAYTYEFGRASLPPHPRRVLEIGFGTGELAAKFAADGLEVVATDNDPAWSRRLGIA